jgi:hypothetical protein
VAQHIRIDYWPHLPRHAFPRRRGNEPGRDAGGGAARVPAGRDPARGAEDTRARQRVPAGGGGPVWEDAETGEQGASCLLLRAQVEQCRKDCREDGPDGRSRADYASYSTNYLHRGL